MSELKFYMDTHISKQVTIQLRQHGVDAIRCEEVGLSEQMMKRICNMPLITRVSS